MTEIGRENATSMREIAEGRPVTPAQCIEARRLLSLTQLGLAKASRLQKSAIVEFEATGHMPRAIDGPNRMAMLTAFFEKAGVEFREGAELAISLRKDAG